MVDLVINIYIGTGWSSCLMRGLLCGGSRYYYTYWYRLEFLSDERAAVWWI